jgi:hypothetical protein
MTTAITDGNVCAVTHLRGGILCPDSDGQWNVDGFPDYQGSNKGAAGAANLLLPASRWGEMSGRRPRAAADVSKGTAPQRGTHGFVLGFQA